MYLNLAARYTQFDPYNRNCIIQFYRINDTKFSYDFAASYVRDSNGNLNDIDHINKLLENIYYTYKFSNQCVKSNFKLVIKKTFPNAHSLIKETNFYKEYKDLIDKILEN